MRVWCIYTPRQTDTPLRPSPAPFRTHPQPTSCRLVRVYLYTSAANVTRESLYERVRISGSELQETLSPKEACEHVLNGMYGPWYTRLSYVLTRLRYIQILRYVSRRIGRHIERTKTQLFHYVTEHPQHTLTHRNRNKGIYAALESAIIDEHLFVSLSHALDGCRTKWISIALAAVTSIQEDKRACRTRQPDGREQMKTSATH